MTSNQRIPIEPKKTPLQSRSRFTVDAILDAAAHILCKDGYADFNTNRVAVKAGVSIGSLYQYFPNKETLIAELRRRHFDDLRSEMLIAFRHAQGLPLDAGTRLLVEASIKAHRIDPKLHKVISNQTPELDLSEDDNSEYSARNLIEQLLMANRHDLRRNLDISLAANIAYRLVENLTHAAVIDDPKLLEHPEFVDELVHVLLAYVR